MKYKGIEVGIPTLDMIQELIDRMEFGFSASELYNHYQKMGWLTKKHQPIKSLEALVNSYNGSYYLPKQGTSNNISKNS